MSIIEIIIIAISLSIDAFIVAICKGITTKKNLKNKIIISSYFSIFQSIMPLLGYIFSIGLKNIFISFSSIISSSILTIIGIQMIKEGLSNKKEKLSSSITFKAMLPLAVATSIDSLAVGITFSLLNVNIIFAIITIGIITFINSYIGVIIGQKFKTNNKNKTIIISGIVLIIIAIKILVV